MIDLNHQLNSKKVAQAQTDNSYTWEWQANISSTEKYFCNSWEMAEKRTEF